MNVPEIHELEQASAEQLMTLIEHAQAALKKHQRVEARRLRRQAERLAASLDTTVEQIMLPGPGRSRGGRDPKYRNPEQPEQTWAGRGAKPNWLREKLAAGHSIDEFLADAAPDH